MRVGFVYLDFSLGSQGKFHEGIALLIAYLRHHGHDCSFLHLREGIDLAAYIGFLRREQPDVVGFSITTHMFPHAMTLAGLTKRYSKALTLFGGPHATLNPEEVIAAEGVDAVCVGEGEQALLELCNRLAEQQDVSKLLNLWVKENGKVHRNPSRPLISDLDMLPFADREIFSYEDTLDLKVLKRGVFMASRGCPYSCSYCSNHALNEISRDSNYVRFRSVGHLLEEIEMVLRKFPSINNIVFHDDILPLRKQWFEDFCTEYQRRIGLPFELNCHPNLMNSDIARMAKSAGCFKICLGIESGNEYIRTNVLDRRVSRDQIVRGFSICHELGIETASYNMIGLPFEGRKGILDTIKLNAWVKSEESLVSVFYPYPKTKIYETCRKEGLLSGKQLDSYKEDTVLRLKAVSPKQLKAFIRYFDLYVRLYVRCYALPRSLRRVIEITLDMAILLTTNSFVLPLTRVLDPLVRKINRIFKSQRVREAPSD